MAVSDALQKVLLVLSILRTVVNLSMLWKLCSHTSRLLQSWVDQDDP